MPFLWQSDGGFEMPTIHTTEFDSCTASTNHALSPAVTGHASNHIALFSLKFLLQVLQINIHWREVGYGKLRLLDFERIN